MDDLRIQVFRKMGYELSKNHGCNIPSCDIRVWGLNKCGHFLKDELPPISSSWEVCAKYLVPFMRHEKYKYSIATMIAEPSYTFFRWHPIQSLSGKRPHADAEIKDDKISEAACKAFMEVEL